MGAGARVRKKHYCHGTVLILDFEVFKTKKQFICRETKLRWYCYLVLIVLKYPFFFLFFFLW